MLTDKDIKEIINYQLEVFKDVFFTKEDFKNIKGKLNRLQDSLDKLALEFKR